MLRCFVKLRRYLFLSPDGKIYPFWTFQLLVSFPFLCFFTGQERWKVFNLLKTTRAKGSAQNFCVTQFFFYLQLRSVVQETSVAPPAGHFTKCKKYFKKVLSHFELTKIIWLIFCLLVDKDLKWLHFVHIMSRRSCNKLHNKPLTEVILHQYVIVDWICGLPYLFIDVCCSVYAMMAG